MQFIELNYKNEYKNSNQTYLKIMGLIWLAFGAVELIFSDNTFGWFHIALGAIHVVAIYHEKPNSYATITNGVFKTNFWFASKTDLTKAKYVKKFAGDVTFVFAEKELRIDTQFLDQESVNQLDEFIAFYNIETEVIPVR